MLQPLVARLRKQRHSKTMSTSFIFQLCSFISSNEEYVHRWWISGALKGHMPKAPLKNTFYNYDFFRLYIKSNDSWRNDPVFIIIFSEIKTLLQSIGLHQSHWAKNSSFLNCEKNIYTLQSFCENCAYQEIACLNMLVWFLHHQLPHLPNPCTAHHFQKNFLHFFIWYPYFICLHLCFQSHHHTGTALWSTSQQTQ